MRWNLQVVQIEREPMVWLRAQKLTLKGVHCSGLRILVSDKHAIHFEVRNEVLPIHVISVKLEEIALTILLRQPHDPRPLLK
jgi:hypothetical protein